jgi:hypothetical protein
VAGVEGDSTTSPLHSAAFAAVRSALAAAGVEHPTLLTPVLYELARDPATYGAVFQDVVTGDNKIFDDECCDAGPGYDLTTGLGQLDFTELTTALIARGRSTALPAVAPTVVPVVIPAFTS